jgi:uncharacterized damage-inducible protein DinB
MSQTAHLDIARRQIEYARAYTLGLLEDVDDDDWFRQPAEGVTHIAWQVGHLAMAQYALLMLRLRGKEPEDGQVISADFFRLFQKGTTPQADPSAYPEPRGIRAVLGRVHQRALEELSSYTDDQLDVKLPEPHAVFDTKMGSVFFCSVHEMLHAGQIGLLRRLLGYGPVR